MPDLLRSFAKPRNVTPRTTRRVTMSDVAKAAGVAPMTVSNCYRAPSKVRPDTLAKVAAAARKLGYVRNLVAGGLASGRSNVVGVLVPSLQNSNFFTMVDGLEDRLSAQGYQMMLSVAKNRASEQSAVRALVERRVDGIVLTGAEHDPGTEAMLRAAQIPIVETWSLKGPFIQMGVGFSLYDAAREITEYLLHKGYRKIGFAGFNPHQSARFHERQRGFQDALAAAGLPSDLLAYSDEARGFSAGTIVLEQLIRKEPGLEAVFCVTDVLAAGVIFECMRRGWKVPDRLAVAGYGDYEIASEMTPAITTVRTPGYEMGVAAAQLLADSLANGIVTSEVVNVGYTLKIRGSA